MKALEYGAVEIIAKAPPRQQAGSGGIADRSLPGVKARPPRACEKIQPSRTVQPKLTADAILSPGTHAMAETTEKVVAIGASTGGTEALKVVLEGFPPTRPAL